MIKYCPKCLDYRSVAAQYQNIKYGLGMRVFNKSAKGLRCTVCENVISK